MKKTLALILALALALALAACGSKDKDTGGTTFALPPPSSTEPERTEAPEPSSEETTESETWSYPWDYEPDEPTTAAPTAYNPPAEQTQAPTKAPTQAQQPGTSATKAPTAVPTNPPTTTKAPTTTQKPTTKNEVFANPINITSAEGALQAFNTSVSTVLSKKPGFGKSHMVTYKDWALDPTFEAMITGIPYVGPTYYQTVLDQLSKILGGGTRMATAHKGDSQQILKASGFKMSDMKDGKVTYSRSGSDWIVTLEVKDGWTRQERRTFTSPVTGSSPIDSGPLHLATGDGGIYDHMTADRFFTMAENFQIPLIGGIKANDIKESTSQIKFVARLDGEGKLVNLKVTYNQTVELIDITVIDANYKNNVGSGTVTIVYDDFQY